MAKLTDGGDPTMGKQSGGLSLAMKSNTALSLSLVLVTFVCCLAPGEAFNSFSVGGAAGSSSFAAGRSWAVSHPWDKSGITLMPLAISRAGSDSGLQKASMSILMNPGKIGVRIPAGFTEGSDFVRDGKNINTGDIVLVTRSDGR